MIGWGGIKAAIAYPRTWGPMPPEPYEAIYCNYDASEMGDGYAKRDHHRVYASPNVKFPPRYQPLASDLKAIEEFEIEQARAAEERAARIQEAHLARQEQARGQELDHVRPEIVARRVNDKAYEIVADERAPARSTYSASYEPYRFESTVKCPPNRFGKNLEYASDNGSTRLSGSGGGKPADLIELQDSWTKTDANRRYNSTFNSKSVDLRLPGGKKKVKNIPAAMI